ncbi:putative Vacuolar protein sorting-associated protein 13C [Hibiscus syriacus]|uniref:Vacuolar protein sorting-associated protein 13C n=1 Tax=Hibiscus syriacus TaxID=106335 RepID=A0A6A3A6J6_HIBSY|nr:uncharacterized protein LOC120132707 [Hibiscus syriacus]KAE8699980.1 putative Vacuolar protein sorting-associated protein 13C [Hibiscus syriacus]
MEFLAPKAQPYFSVTDEKMNKKAEEHGETNKVVTSQLQIRSSARSSRAALEKEVVLRRIRNHKCKNRVRSAFQALVGGDVQAQDKWMELGDAFTCP